MCRPGGKRTGRKKSVFEKGPGQEKIGLYGGRSQRTQGPSLPGSRGGFCAKEVMGITLLF
jgi:hypothetical protein